MYKIIKKIIGNIEPYGDTNIDKERSENLENHMEVTYNLVRDLVEVSRHKDRHEYSMKDLGISAFEQLMELKRIIDNEID